MVLSKGITVVEIVDSQLLVLVTVEGSCLVSSSLNVTEVTDDIVCGTVLVTLVVTVGFGGGGVETTVVVSASLSVAVEVCLEIEVLVDRLVCVEIETLVDVWNTVVAIDSVTEPTGPGVVRAALFCASCIFRTVMAKVTVMPTITSVRTPARMPHLLRALTNGLTGNSVPNGGGVAGRSMNSWSRS